MANTANQSSYGFSFSRAMLAGFLATLLIEILIYIQGQNPALSMGKMILGPDSMPLFMYIAGGGFCLLVGLIFALFYALIIAPMRFMSDLIQGILFAGIMTAISIYTFPRLQDIFDVVLKRQPEVALVKLQEESTEFVKAEESPEEESKEGKKGMLLYNYMNHLIYALAVIVVYRQRKRE